MSPPGLSFCKTRPGGREHTRSSDARKAVRLWAERDDERCWPPSSPGRPSRQRLRWLSPGSRGGGTPRPSQPPHSLADARAWRVAPRAQGPSTRAISARPALGARPGSAAARARGLSVLPSCGHRGQSSAAAPRPWPAGVTAAAATSTAGTGWKGCAVKGTEGIPAGPRPPEIFEKVPATVPHAPSIQNKEDKRGNPLPAPGRPPSWNNLILYRRSAGDLQRGGRR